MRIFAKLIVITILLKSSIGLAQSLSKTTTSFNSVPITNPVADKAEKEELIPNYVGIALYKPTYALPYYYTGSPDNKVYRHHTPGNEHLTHDEVKYQFSIKVPVWKNILDYPSSLYLALTQLTYWQFYNKYTFIRETDYEPEVFLANYLNRQICNDFGIDFLNVGFAHQSNGFGTSQERSWNRFYVEAITSINNWMFDLKPWVIISKNQNNKNIANFLGYGSLIVSCKTHQHVFSLQTYNLIESAGRRPTGIVTWSFPITHYIKGYVQVFSGYGQSLIEYNHHTNSAGIGIAFNDWI